MVRLVEQSRITVVVLTEDWLGSAFTAFEAQISHGPVVILQIDSAEVPPTFRPHLRIRIDGEGTMEAWEELRSALLPHGPPAARIAIHFRLHKAHSTSNALGFEYEASLAIDNLGSQPAIFDAIAIEVHPSHRQRERPGAAHACYLCFTEEGLERVLEYPGSKGMPTSSAPVSPVSLPPHRRMEIPAVGLGPFRYSVAGQEAVLVSTRVHLARHPVSEPTWGVLPPLSRLPESGPRKPHLAFMIQDAYASPPSGVLDSTLWRKVLDTAAGYARDALLVSVIPSTVTVFSMTGGQFLHGALGWRYRFASRERGKFIIAARDPTWVEEDGQESEPTSGSREMPKLWLDAPMLSRCTLDASAAYLVALQSAPLAAITDGTSPFHLMVLALDGRWTPLWVTPRLLDDHLVTVTADTCEVALLGDGACKKVRGSLWNV